MAFVRDPDSILDWSVDWTDWLYDDDTIVASVWSCPDTDLSIDSDSHTDTTATAWISGGTSNVTYVVTNHIVCTSGRADDRSLTIKCKER